jgi:hypothetical protein
MDPRYISAVSCQTLIHGGLSHRPLLFEELIRCKSYLGFIGYLTLSFLLVWEGTCIGFSCLILAMSSAKNHSVTSLSQACFSDPQNLLSKYHACSEFSLCCYWQSGSEIAGSGRKFLAGATKAALRPKKPSPRCSRLSLKGHGGGFASFFPTPSATKPPPSPSP